MAAPVPDAAAICRTPSASPSLRSMHALAARLRPSSAPMRTRGSGAQWRRTHAAMPSGCRRAPARRPLDAFSQPRPAAAAPTLPGDVEVVAGAPAPARQHVPRAREPGDGDVDHQRARAIADVAAGQRDARVGRQRQESVDERVHLPGRAVRRQRQREQRQPRRAAHRRDVGEVHGERLPADVARRAEPAIEVDAFDEAVGGEDLQRAALGLHHRRIVADADEQPRRRRGDAGADLAR